MKKEDLKIDQTIYIKKSGNSARYLNQINAPLEDYISEHKITKIGNKYFTINHNSQYEIETGNNKLELIGSKAYLTKQEIYDEKRT